MRLHVAAAAALAFVVSTAGVVTVAVPADASGTKAPDGTSGTLTLSQGGNVPVAGGTFCTNGVAPVR